MVHEHFGLNRMPFSSAPDTSLMVDVPAMSEVVQRTRICVESGSGVTVVIGQPGTGKSLLMEKLAIDYVDNFRVVNLVCPRIASRSDFLQNILFEVGRRFRKRTESELRLSLFDYIKKDDECVNGMLLLVDEAHMIPARPLDELRQMMNIVREGKPGVRLVMAGTYPLEEQLNDPKLEALTQRVTGRLYLNALTRDETYFYVISQVQICGRDGREIFEPAALDAIHKISEGVPRVINQLCQHAMISAAHAGCQMIDGKLINMTWSELQCIPYTSPEPTVPKSRNVSAVVEFGTLSDGISETSEHDTDSDSERDSNSNMDEHCNSATMDSASLDSESKECESNNDCCKNDSSCDNPHSIEMQSEYQLQPEETCESVQRHEMPEDLQAMGHDENNQERFDANNEESNPTNQQPETESNREVAMPDVDCNHELDSQSTVDHLIEELDRMDSSDPNQVQMMDHSEMEADQSTPESREQTGGARDVENVDSPIQSQEMDNPIVFHHELILGMENPIDTPTDEPSDDWSEPTPPSGSSMLTETETPRVNNPFAEEDFTEEESVSGPFGQITTEYNRSSATLEMNDLAVLESQDPEEPTDQAPIAFVSRIQPEPEQANQQVLDHHCDSIADDCSTMADGNESGEMEKPKDADRLAIEYPIVNHSSYESGNPDDERDPSAEAENNSEVEDDRDMIIVSRVENVVRPADEDDDEEARTPPPSQGRAVRVELKDLFKQLRSFENDS